MKLLISIGALLVFSAPCSAVATPNPAELLVGVYSNEEQVYFDNLAGRPTAKWLSLHIRAEGHAYLIEEPDAFGKQEGESHRFTAQQEGAFTILDYGTCQRIYRMEGDALIADGLRGTCQTATTITSISPFAIILTFPDGTSTQLRRARGVSCWVGVRKDQPKEDGSEDWHFQSGVRLHDQGGRAIVGGGNSGSQQVMVRIRNVTWDKNSTNAPVLALYIHKADNWDHAESYSWAAPDSARVGVNLRWVQAGCSIDDAGAPSKLSADKFTKQEVDKQ